eukprot:scaffold434_cov186-Pinguiococcus_pyrenoidosus.AAC.53
MLRIHRHRRRSVRSVGKEGVQEDEVMRLSLQNVVLQLGLLDIPFAALTLALLAPRHPRQRDALEGLCHLGRSAFLLGCVGHRHFLCFVVELGLVQAVGAKQHQHGDREEHGEVNQCPETLLGRVGPGTGAVRAAEHVVKEERRPLHSPLAELFFHAQCATLGEKRCSAPAKPHDASGGFHIGRRTESPSIAICNFARDP